MRICIARGASRATTVRLLDAAGIVVGVLLAPFLSDGYSLHDAASLRRRTTISRGS